ncbi:hypothetical protein [Candidatus Palauibacter soopunensis]|uniref:hypothetical protein n=1 Tax=Candidatus Palauibacter soopunensis TaxID=3056739 RepID=UPI0023A58AC7|nr:hypothetical protein [Candidatus Palauibacter soopunensis]MDE2878542.1 hypothetical protein [Candidatus Palauibacter soopunensis]
MLMRFVMRLLAFVVVILAAFWFSVRNGSELVNVVLPFLRIRAPLPLVVFACILGGMGLSGLLAWRAELRARRLASRAASARLAFEPPAASESPAASEPPAPPGPSSPSERSEPSPLL